MQTHDHLISSLMPKSCLRVLFEAIGVSESMQSTAISQIVCILLEKNSNAHDHAINT